MKSLSAIRIVFLSALLTAGIEPVNAQLGIGLRGGDPSGLTFKKYNGDHAIELSIGRTHWINGRGWYNKHYDHWYDHHYNSSYTDFNVITYRAYMPLGMQLHFLKHRDLKLKGEASDLSGLTWYYGGGLFVGYQRYHYDYRYKVEGNPDWIYVDRDTYVNLDLGLDGVIGLEYTFEEVPVSVFLDVSLYMELFDQPFLFGSFGGIGVRVNL